MDKNKDIFSGFTPEYADKKEFITFSGIELKGMNNLFSIAYSAISFPFSEYTLLEIGG